MTRRFCLLAAMLCSCAILTAADFPQRLNATGPDFKPLQCPLPADFNPNEGTFSFDYTPRFSRSNKGLEFYRFFHSGDVTAGINVFNGNAITQWFHMKTEETGPNYGVYKPFAMVRGKTYRMQQSWNLTNMALLIDGKLIGTRELTRPLPFAKTIQLGGFLGKDADGLMTNFAYSPVSCLPMPVHAKPHVSGATVELFKVQDTASYASAVVSSPASSVTLTFTPQHLAIRRQQSYWVESNAMDPQILTATDDHTLSVTLPPCHFNQITISPTGDNLIPNGDFETPGLLPPGWQATQNGKPLPTLGYGHEGFGVQDTLAKGAMTSDNLAAVTTVPRTGAQSLILGKRSPDGAIMVTSPCIPLQPGQDYLLTGFYNSPDMHFGSGTAMILNVTADNQKTQYLYALTMARATRAKQWRMAYAPINISAQAKNPRATLMLTATGAPFHIRWDDLDLRKRPVILTVTGCPPRPGQLDDAVSTQQLQDLLSKTPQHTAQVKRVNGTPQLLINGKISPKFGYVGFLRAGHKDFYDHGVKLQWLYTITGNPGQNNWRGTPLWLADGKFDFHPLDLRLEKLLRKIPEATVMIHLGMNPYLNFFKKYPHAAARDVNGKTMPDDDSVWCSYADEDYRREGEALMRALARHLNQSPYGKAVAGIHICGGRDTQWFPHAYDGSEGNRRAFIAWLKTRYHNRIDDLRKAWKDPQITFQKVTVPKPEEANGLTFLNPQIPGHQRLMDGERFRSEAPVETVNRFAKAFKQTINHPVYISLYYNDISAGFDLGKNALKKLLVSPWIDGYVGVVDYGYNRLNGYTGASVNLLGSSTLHDKTYLAELDYRTEYADMWWPRAAGGWGPDIVGNTFGAEDNLHQQRRDMGMFLAAGQGAWMYGLAGNCWPHPDMLKAIEEANRNAIRSATQARPQDRGDVACFLDEQMLDTMGWGPKPDAPFRTQIHQVATNHARIAFYRSGLKTDFYLLSDLTHPRLKDYRMYVFLTSPTMTAEQRDWITRKLQRKGKVLVFTFDAARLTPGGLTRNVQTLTGIRVKLQESTTVTYRFKPQELPDPLARGLRYLGTETRGPAFVVDDPTAIPLGYYQDTNLLGAAVKRHRDWTGIYLGAPGGITPDFLRAAAAEAGIAPAGPSGDATYAGNGFLTIHATRSGNKTIRWQGNYDLLDLATNAIVTRNVNTLTIPMEAGTTRTFWLQPR